MPNTKRRKAVLTSRSLPRASERQHPGIKLDAKAPALRDLMTEQSRVRRGDIGWATFYSGSAADLVKAGLPPAVLPTDGKRHKLRINARDAFIQKNGGRFELTLTWDGRGPWYYSATHPALSELARMILISVCYWQNTCELDRTDEVPTKKLLSCERAVDYRLPGSRRFRFGPGTQDRISSLAQQIYHELHNSEIFPLVEGVAPDDAFDADVVDVSGARRTLERIADRAKRGKLP